MLRPLLICTIAWCSIHSCFAQSKKKFVRFKSVHFGIVQGIGTNGLQDLRVENNFSFNLFSGQSYSNKIFCLAGISHYQIQESYGINISGVANVVGGFPFVKPQHQKDTLATFNALQFSGLVNVANGTGLGGQVSGGVNAIAKDLNGAQIGGFYNFIGGDFSGVQLSVIANRFNRFGLGVQSGFVYNYGGWLSGAQLFGIANVAKYELDGFQLGIWNYVGNGQSVSYRKDRFYWIQLGLFNVAFNNGDGTQVGLINFGKDVGFSQIGLINISNKVPQYPFGLLNLASDVEGFVRMHTDRIFRYNFEIATGSKKILNGIAYSFDKQKNHWGLGYFLGNQWKGGYKKNRYFVDSFVTVKQMITEGDRFLDPNLLYGVKFDAGYNPFLMTKFMDMFFFIGIEGSVKRTKGGEPLVGDFFSFSNGKNEWLANFNFGVQL